MKRTAICSAALVATLSLAGAVHAADRSMPTRQLAMADKDGPRHDHGTAGKEEDHKGEKKDLGTQKIGTFEVQVTQVGDVKPGEEAIFIIRPTGDGGPKAVRAWVGVESGQGSIRTKAEEEKAGEWHAHHPVSKPLPPKGKLWVELETAAGKPKGSFALK